MTLIQRAGDAGDLASAPRPLQATAHDLAWSVRRLNEAHRVAREAGELAQRASLEQILHHFQLRLGPDHNG